MRINLFVFIFIVPSVQRGEVGIRYGSGLSNGFFFKTSSELIDTVDSVSWTKDIK